MRTVVIQTADDPVKGLRIEIREDIAYAIADALKAAWLDPSAVTREAGVTVYFKKEEYHEHQRIG